VAGLVRQPTASAGDQVRRLAAEAKLARSTGQAGIARPRLEGPSAGRIRSARLADPDGGSRGETVRTRSALPASRSPTSEESELLQLLQRGLKDRAIARALGIGERTVQRRLSRLMTTLGAKTRFQAAINAVRRGWL
jgi:DNA-binding NarL/FixJ family response regulator